MNAKHGITVVIKRSVLDFDCVTGGTPRDLQTLLLFFIVLQINMSLLLMQPFINVN
jgi:hypothetical protein